MSKKLQIRIPEPCGENWEGMEQDGKGRFCMSCSKTVVDFSLMTDQEVLSYLGTQSARVCGRFTPDQIGRDIRIGQAAPKKSWTLVWRLALVGMLLSVKSQAQQKIPKPGLGKVEKKKAPECRPTMGITMIVSDGEPLTIQVVDEITRLPVPFASVHTGADQKVLVTDTNGICRLTIGRMGQNRLIEISSVGYLSQKVSMSEAIHDRTPLTIALSRMVNNLPELMVTSWGTTVGKIAITGAVTSISETDTLAEDSVLKRFLSDTMAFFGAGPKPLSVYPNPVLRGSVVRLDLRSDRPGAFHLGLYNTAGALMLEKQLELSGKSQTELLSIPSSLSAGVYFLKMDLRGPGKNFTKKLVVL